MSLCLLAGLLLILLAKEVRVRACAEHDEKQFPVVLLPYEKPVGQDVALPLPLAVAVQLVSLILLVELLAAQQLGHNILQFLHRQAPLLADFQILLALAGDAQFVFRHPSISFIKSSRLSYL